MLCVCCKIEKDISDFRFHTTGHRMRYCIACHLEKRRNQYAKNREHRRALVRENYASNKNGMKDKYAKARKEKYARDGRDSLVKWIEQNPDRAKEAFRKKVARYRKNLTDYYVNRLLIQHDGLPPRKCPQPLIECKRLQLKIERTIDEKRRAT